jgi:lipopolysaccharide export system ATP-binding protein
MAPNSYLKIESISKQYKGRKVVQSASFEIKAGQVVGLLGPNGAGKTTSFYMVVGLVQPDSGRIQFNDLDITNFPMYKRARSGLSYLAQEPSIFRRMTVEDNILVALEAHGLEAKEKHEKLESLLQEFRVNHIRESFGFSLSGGERRRVEIARALAGSPHFFTPR